MAEECVYYFFDGWDYCCRLLKNSGKKYEVNKDWVESNCWNYNYERCPYYQNRTEMDSSSSGCFLTSACVLSKGLPDDCEELQTLRHFRDTYVRSRADGKETIKTYYQVAPKIVDGINRSDAPDSVWERIYVDLVLPTIALIHSGKNEEAFQKYKMYAEMLEKQYSPIEE